MLVGCTIAHGGCSGVIVETEAYHETEPACHAFAGLTPRTRPLFEAPGIAYVYRSYGIHALLNVVVEPAGRRRGRADPRARAADGHRRDARAPRPRPLDRPVLGPGQAHAGARHRPRPQRDAAARRPDRARPAAARSRAPAVRRRRARGSGSRAPSSCRGASARRAAATSRGRGRRACSAAAAARASGADRRRVRARGAGAAPPDGVAAAGRGHRRTGAGAGAAVAVRRRGRCGRRLLGGARRRPARSSSAPVVGLGAGSAGRGGRRPPPPRVARSARPDRPRGRPRCSSPAAERPRRRRASLLLRARTRASRRSWSACSTASMKSCQICAGIRAAGDRLAAVLACASAAARWDSRPRRRR